jgi:hypothetical protein
LQKVLEKRRGGQVEKLLAKYKKRAATPKQKRV